MVSSMVNIPGYRISEELYNGSRTLVYRGYRETDSLPVVIKLLKNPYPTFSELLSFRNQYTIAKNLNSPLIIQTYSLEPYQNTYALVMEDFGGISLKDYFTSDQRRYIASIEEFLPIAIALCNALDVLYQERIIHKDIKPANILINPETKEVKLIDFSIASLLPRETQEIQNANAIEGTLSYLSPEQTGRMNRGIDYRTDFYSLGITFYELLTGQLPFIYKDPMELVHSHLAKTPIPVHEINSHIPLVLSAIINKLMAKNAEDRYQSALEIKDDLETCLERLQVSKNIEHFEIAQNYLSVGVAHRRHRFLIREKLYGRETEVQQLLEAFERVSQGSSELMLVAGFSGIGKTSVVNEIHKPIVRQRGYFISGKFDQFGHNVPYSAIASAFGKLIQQLLTESESQFQKWRDKLQNTLQNSGQIMIKLIPEIELIIGKQPSVPDLRPLESQIRFNSIFQRFIGIFCDQEHPLVIFLDDLQWADSATLKLIELMLNDVKIDHLFLIGAYRDNEVSPTHPLILMADRLRKADATINQILLSPLCLDDISHLIADTLHSNLETIQPLSNLTIRKTEGNPFFVNEFLKALHEEELLKFHLPTQQWTWNIDQIEAMGITDHVVELMVGKLKKLPASTQQALSLAACIGATFDLTTLSIICEQSRSAIYADLMPALQLGFILPTSKLDNDFLIPTYRFGHDRIQEAADALIPLKNQQSVHLKIGRLILQHSSSEMIAERLFEIVEHLNLGIELINQLEEQIELVHLNLQATLKAKAALAYEPALKYMLSGMKLMGDRLWHCDSDLAMNMYRERADVEFLNGNFEASHSWIIHALEKARTNLEKADIYIRQMVLHTLSGNYPQALISGYQAAALLDIEVPLGDPKPIIQAGMEEIEALLADKSIASLLDLPEMTDPVKKLSMKLFGELVPTTYLARQELFPWVNVMMVLFSMKYGLHLEGFVGFACYGMILVSETEKYQEAYEFGNVALKLSQQYNDAVQICRSCHIISSFLTIWVNHVRYSGEIKQLGGKGDLTYAGYNQAEYLANIFFAGNTVEDILTEIKIVQGDLEKFENQYTETITAAFRFFLMDLSGEPEATIFYQKRDLIEKEFIQYCEELKLFAGLCTHYVLQLIRCYLFEDWENAYEKMRQAEALILNRRAAMLVPIFYLYSCLILTVKYQQVAFHEQEKIREELQLKLKQIQVWSVSCSENFAHLNWVVQAEIARISNCDWEAMELYDRAIASAHQHGFVHHEGIIHEQVAKFWLQRGKEAFANVHLNEAYYAYQKWGAKAKVADMEIRYSQLQPSMLRQPQTSFDPLETFVSIINSSAQSSSTSISDALDFASVIKAAQLLSSTIELDELLQQLTQIILQNSGGSKCILVLPQNETWLLRAISTPEATKLCSEPLDDHPDVPIKLIQYVKRTQSVVVIDNLQTDLPVIDDYLIQRQPKSILCLPILNQGHLAGILYLKNQSTTGVFTSDRLTIINFLCTQAAISLENARLYEESQTYTQQLEGSLAKLQVSETRFQNLANNIPGVVYQFRLGTDGSTSTPYISAGCLDLYGLDPESVMAGNHNLYALHHPEDNPAIAQAIAYSAQNLTQFAQEWRIILPSGIIKWIQSAARPERQADGAILWDGVVIDISNRKLAEQQLQTSQQFLQLLINNIPQLVFWKDRNSTFLGCNISAAKTINLESPEQIVGKNDYDISIPEEAEWYRLCDRRVMESGEAELHIIETQQQADATQHWLDTNKIPLRDPDNNVIGILATIEDITDRKHAEATLQEKEQFLRSIYDGAEIAIFVLDVLSDGSFRYAGWNPASEKATGIRSVDVAGKTVTEVMGEEQGQRFQQRFAEIVTTGIDVSYEEHLCLQGQETWWFANLNPIKNLEGRVYRIIGTTFNISDRKKAELALQQKSLLLQQALTDLQNTQLQMVQSEKMSALGNLVAGVAHEMNNPLGFISASLEQAKPTFGDIIEHLKLYQEIFPNKSEEIIDHAVEIDLDYSLEDLPKMLDSMSMACDRLKNISTSLRTFSRADQDYKVPFNIHQGIDSTILILKHRLKANDQRPAIEVITNYGNLPQVECFPGQLNQVFMNLIANAIDALDESNTGRTFEGIKGNPNCITITTSVENNLVKITIADNGQGMNKEVKSKIFDHLFTTKAVGKGTGLGLAIARQIVESTHGGKLSFNSVFGKGTEFIIEVPL